MPECLHPASLLQMGIQVPPTVIIFVLPWIFFCLICQKQGDVCFEYPYWLLENIVFYKLMLLVVLMCPLCMHIYVRYQSLKLHITNFSHVLPQIIQQLMRKSTMMLTLRMCLLFLPSAGTITSTLRHDNLTMIRNHFDPRFALTIDPLGISLNLCFLLSSLPTFKGKNKDEMDPKKQKKLEKEEKEFRKKFKVCLSIMFFSMFDCSIVLKQKQKPLLPYLNETISILSFVPNSFKHYFVQSRMSNQYFFILTWCHFSLLSVWRGDTGVV